MAKRWFKNTPLSLKFELNMANSYFDVIVVLSTQVKLYLFLQSILKKKIEDTFLVPIGTKYL